MKRRFAVPAAIALTAHALLFMGWGKPPAPPAEPVAVNPNNPPLPVDKDVFDKTVQLVDDEIKTIADPAEKPIGDGGDVMPVGIPEIPHPEGPRDWIEITQDRVPVNYGPGNKITSLRIASPGGDRNRLGDAAVSVAMLDKPPRTSSQKEPIYPQAMRVAGTKGTVWVEFTVDETGRVHDARVLKSTHPDFEEATIAAVSLWRFEPGKRKGKPVCFRMSIPVVFNLTE
jgi:protein TonB